MSQDFDEGFVVAETIARAEKTSDNVWVKLRAFDAIWFHAGSLIAAAAALLLLTRNLWFVGDEWEFLAYRVVPGSLQLLTPHNEHWSTIPILVYDGLYHVFGLHSHLPYQLTLIAVLALTVHVAWRLMRRAGVDGLLASLIALVLFTAGAGSDDIVSTFQMTFVASVLFGLLAVRVADRDGAWHFSDAGVWALAVASLMCSGIGLTMLAVTILFALIRRGWRAAFAVGVVPTVVYALWLETAGSAALQRDAIGMKTLVQVPWFILRGVTTSLDGLVGVTGSGWILAAGLTGYALFRLRSGLRTVPAAYAITGGVIVLFGLIGLARIEKFGWGIPPRYIWIALALMLPLAAVALNALSKRGRALYALVAAALLVMIAHGSLELRQSVAVWHGMTQTSQTRVLTAAALLRSGTPMFDDQQPDPLYATDATVATLRLLLAQDAVPGFSPAPDDVVAAHAFTQTAFTRLQRYPLQPATAHISGAAVTATAGECASVVPARAGGAPVLLTFDLPGNVEVTSSVAGNADVAVDNTSVLRPVESGAPTYLAVLDPSRKVSLTLPGPAWVCGITATG